MKLKVKTLLPASLLWLSAVTFGCSGGNWIGDAVLIDNGIFTATDRYELRFTNGVILCGESFAAKLEGLPEQEFVFGLELWAKLDDSHKLPQSIRSIPVQMLLQTASGEKLIDVKSDLSSWVVNSKRGFDRELFLYIREPIDGPGNRGTSYIRTNPRDQYTLQLNVGSDYSCPESVAFRVYASAGGWKS